MRYTIIGDKLPRANASKLGKKHASHNERRGALWKKVHSQSYSAV